MIIKPQIKFPCHEDWNSMKIGIYSRHCQSCKKDVMDFTGMSREQILTYLLSNYDNEICGRAYTHQLDFTHSELLITVNALSRNPQNNNLAFFLLTIGTLILTSCHSDGKKEKHKSEWSVAFDDEDEIEKEKQNREICSREILGEMVIQQPEVVYSDTVGTKYDSSDRNVGRTPIASDDTSAVYTIVDEMPEFRGGMGALISYIKKNVKYPEVEKKSKIEGTVYATFMIDEKGAIHNLEIMEGKSSVSENFRIEVIRVLSGMPHWKPGRLRGKKVKVQYYLPVKFEL